MINIDKMNGYDFEKLICDLLRKMDFDVEQTVLSGDGGIDIIANSSIPLFKGTYLIQCKRWESNVGEPTIRDMYGVVNSQNAIKGIIITNSFFSEKAIAFAEGKNLELIDGNSLNILLQKYFGEELLIKDDNVKFKTYFTNVESFDIDKYKYYKNWIETDKKNKDAYLKMFNFLYSYIIAKNIEIMYSGLIEECIKLADDIIHRFGKKTKEGNHIIKVFIDILAFLYILTGKIDVSFELTKNNNMHIVSNINNLTTEFQPKKWGNWGSLQCEYKDIFPCSTVFLKNYYVVFNSIDFLNGTEYVYKKYFDHYHTQKNLFLYDIEEKNKKLFQQAIENIHNGLELFIHIPKLDLNLITYNIYSNNLYFKVSEIISHWSTDVDIEEQKKRISFLILV